MAVCTILLPAASADDCAINARFGRVDKILWTRLGDDLDDDSDLSEWTTRKSNSTSLPSSPTLAPIRFLNVIGELPLPETTTAEASLGRKVISTPSHTLTVDCDDLSTTNATLLNTLQGTSYTYAFWFVCDGQLYGGTTGIEATMSFVGRVIPREKTALQTMRITINWEGKIPVPIADPGV